MKIYTKQYKDASSTLAPNRINNIGSSYKTVTEFEKLVRSFYRDAHSVIFDLLVKQVWIEQNFLYAGVRRSKRALNGYGVDRSYAFFMTQMVGISQKILTTGQPFTSIPTYFGDFFPKFSDHNPFEEPEYFKFPYKHVTLDFLCIVFQHHERLEMLDYAEKNKMTIREFTNWAINQALCYNDEMNKEIYDIKRHSFIAYIRRIK